MSRRSVGPALVGAFALAVLSSGTAVAGHAAFTDTGATPHAAAIDWLAENGIASGCGDGRFCPEAAVTRGQLATLLQRLSGNDPAVPATVDAATVGGVSAEELRSTSAVLGRAESAAAATIEEYASQDTSVPVAQLEVVVPSGVTQMVQLLITYDETHSTDKTYTADCGVGVGAQSSAVRVRLDGLRVYEVYAGAHPPVVHREDAEAESGTIRLAFTFITVLDPGRHTFALNLEGACGDTGSAGGGRRTVEHTRMSLLDGGTFVH